MKLIITLSALMALISSVQAQNSLSAGMTLETVLALIGDQGYSGEITDPNRHSANVSIGNNVFGVDGYNCNGNECTEFLFSIGYDLENGFPLDKVNEWNSTRVGGRASLDGEGDPWVDHIISVSSPDDVGAFNEGFVLWIDVIRSFEAFLDENSAPGA